MRTAKSNRPVAVLREKACTICGIEQNSIVITAINRGEGMVNCQNCGRILIRL
jgi:predicted  nucleic acid-binding Zn-ribbon protein